MIRGDARNNVWPVLDIVWNKLQQVKVAGGVPE